MIEARVFNRDDAEFICRMYYEPKVQKYFRYFQRVGYTADQFVNAPQILGGIVLVAVEDGERKGFITFVPQHLPVRVYKVGMVADPRFHGQDVGFQMSCVGVDWAFRVMNADKLVVEVISSDTKWAEYIKAFGFTHEGTLRGQAFYDGIVQDELIYGLLKEEYLRR